MRSPKQYSTTQNDMAATCQMSLLNHQLSTTRSVSPLARLLLSKSPTIKRRMVATKLHPSRSHRQLNHMLRHRWKPRHNSSHRCRCKAREQILSLQETRLNSQSASSRHSLGLETCQLSHSHRAPSAMKTTQRKRCN